MLSANDSKTLHYNVDVPSKVENMSCNSLPQFLAVHPSVHPSLRFSACPPSVRRSAHPPCLPGPGPPKPNFINSRSTSMCGCYSYELILNGQNMTFCKSEILENAQGRFSISRRKKPFEKSHIWEQLPNAKSVQTTTLMIF